MTLRTNGQNKITLREADNTVVQKVLWSKIVHHVATPSENRFFSYKWPNVKSNAHARDPTRY
jgi:hypothetical protein